VEEEFEREKKKKRMIWVEEEIEIAKIWVGEERRKLRKTKTTTSFWVELVSVVFVLLDDLLRLKKRS